MTSTEHMELCAANSEDEGALLKPSSSDHDSGREDSANSNIDGSGSGSLECGEFSQGRGGEGRQHELLGVGGTGSLGEEGIRPGRGSDVIAEASGGEQKTQGGRAAESPSRRQVDSRGRSRQGRSSSRQGRSRSRERSRQGRSSSRQARSRSRQGRSRSRQRGVSRGSDRGPGRFRSRSRSWDRQERRRHSRSPSRNRHQGRRDSRSRSRTAPRQRSWDRSEPGRRERPRDEFDTLFVGDLPWKATSQSLFEVFNAQVPSGIAEARVMTGNSYGFITFKDPQAAAVLLSEAGEGGTGPQVYMDGRVLRVGRADKRQMPQEGGRHRRGNASSPSGYSRVRVRPRLRDSHTASPAERSARAAAAAIVSGATALLQQGAAHALLQPLMMHGGWGQGGRGPSEGAATPGSGGGRSGGSGAMAAWPGAMMSPQNRHVLSYDDL